VDTKINIYVLSIVLKQHSFLIIDSNITDQHRVNTKKLTFEIDEKSVENEPPCWQADDVTGRTHRQCKILI